ncbi:Nitrogen regulation protein NtrB [hydrothermal vent metagenome]|uniref:Sensory histidine kinase/phosphatase NtrB n=1 Tax=hydrothermal vent metagenome TaxID=652676 RepID=A0A3B0XJJ6_9ZZZZ
MGEQDLSSPGYQQTILDNLSTAVILLNTDLRIDYINPASENLFQISSRQANGAMLDKIMLADKAFMSRLENALTDIHPISEYEARLKLPAGREIIIDYTLNPLLLADQKIHLMLEISHMDRHIRIAREKQQLSEQSVTRNLIRGMAHEIKNPLGGLRGAAQLLERELPNDELKEYTQIIIGEADRLQSLVNRILGPNNIPKKRNINIHQVLEHVRQLIQVELPEHATVRFKLDYDPSLPEIMADPDMLIQAILNITRNAVFALNGNGLVTFKTRPLRHFTIGERHHRLVLKTDIIDNGATGIPEDLQPHIFFPMVSGRAQGTGLGLSIAQSLINQHDGLIKMNSQPGATVFTLYLPFSNIPEKRPGNRLAKLNGDTP